MLKCRLVLSFLIGDALGESLGLEDGEAEGEALGLEDGEEEGERPRIEDEKLAVELEVEHRREFASSDPCVYDVPATDMATWRRRRTA